MTTNDMASWAEVLSGPAAGEPLAALTATTKAWLRSWQMAGSNGEDEGVDPDAVEELHRTLRRLHAHTPAPTPDLTIGWQVDLEIITAHGPVRVRGRLCQDTVVDVPTLRGPRGDVVRSHPCRALTVVTAEGLPVLAWADRVVRWYQPARSQDITERQV